MARDWDISPRGVAVNDNASSTIVSKESETMLKSNPSPARRLINSVRTYTVRGPSVIIARQALRAFRAGRPRRGSVLELMQHHWPRYMAGGALGLIQFHQAVVSPFSGRIASLKDEASCHILTLGQGCGLGQHLYYITAHPTAIDLTYLQVVTYLDFT